MHLSDEIESITFRNDDNGYTVARLKNSGLTAVGTFAYITVGQEFDFTGDFVQNAKYGKQFVVKSYELVPPNSPAKIKVFLGSGLIEGIGPVIAGRIVKMFGAGSLAVIEREPEKLEQVKGISARKAKIIGERYSEIKEMQVAIVYLQKFEISMNMAIRIYNYYKDRTIERVQTNPYALIETIDGIGFLTADKMAQDLGISYTGNFRVRAGVVYVLKQSSEVDGNTYLPHDVLRAGVCRLLKIKMEQLEPVFDGVVRELCLDKYLTAVKDGYMLNKFYIAERAVASRLATLCHSECNEESQVLAGSVGTRDSSLEARNDNIDSLLQSYQQVYKIKLHKKQIEAIKMACTNGVSVITGGPGTGKTTIVRAILYVAAAEGNVTQLLAPTGRAAKRLEETTGHVASTIHRGLGIEHKNTRGLSTGEDYENAICADVVIVDEVSMCDAMLMSQLLKKVLSGTRVVLVGDSDQLPSVGAGNVLADIIASDVVPVVSLTEIYRQTENSQIVTSAHAINRGEMPLLDNKSEDFFFERCETPADIKHKILGLVCDRIPNYLGCGTDRIQVLCPMKMGEAGMNSLNVALQEKLNPAESGKGEYTYGETVYRVGDRVMQTVNNYNQEWTKPTVHVSSYKEGEFSGMGVFNGDIGTVTAVDRQSGEVSVCLEDGRETIYTRADLNNLVLAYAITVHKSQGCEFDVVVIPVTSGAYMILTRNLLYTAVTRAKRMVMLVGSAENLAKMVGNNYTKKRHTMLREFLVEMKQKAEQMFNLVIPSEVEGSLPTQ